MVQTLSKLWNIDRSGFRSSMRDAVRPLYRAGASAFLRFASTRIRLRANL